MEKLMELLRKYEIKRRKNSCLIKKIPYWNNNDIKKNRFLIISKEYGFIKWLVDNDKIEFPTSCAIDKNNDYSEREIKSDYESLLMLLAISDSPLEFLCKILK